MTSSTSSDPPSRGVWPSLAPYVGPPCAASLAIIPVFYGLMVKSAQQQGLPAPSITSRNLLQGVKGGIGAAPTVGAMVGAQMVLQDLVQNTLAKTFPNFFIKGLDQAELSLTFTSSVLVAGLSSPLVAVYNGKTMTPPWSFRKSLSKFSPKQAGAILLQETGFIAGLAAAGPVSVRMKQWLGDNEAVAYLAASTTAALGSLAGHPGNTALTRWQNGMTVDKIGQLYRGAVSRMGVSIGFGIVYRFITKTLNSTGEGKK